MESKNNKREKLVLLKEEKIGKIAHELRTPLNAILGYTQLILHKNDCSFASLEYINAIQKCGEQILERINEISNISKENTNIKNDKNQSNDHFDIYNIAKKIKQTNFDKTNLKTKNEHNSCKVLVVDYSNDNRQFVINTLDILGLATKEASDWNQALKILKKWNPDLILLDTNPDINLHDIIKRIRKHEKSEKHVIIIAFFDSFIEIDFQAVIESGCDDYLLKPFKLNILIDLIGKYIDLHSCKKNIYQSNKENYNSKSISKSIKMMPSKWFNQFKESIEMLDPIKTKFQISKLEKKDFKAAAVLNEWVKNFNFDRLQQLIEEI